MRLISTSLSLNTEPALADLSKAISDIRNVKHDPFIILAQNKTNYLQTIYLDNDYVLEYQSGSVEERFRSKDNLNQDVILKAFELYLKGDILWKNGIEFEKISKTQLFIFRLGYIAGRIAIKIRKIFKI